MSVGAGRRRARVRQRDALARIRDVARDPALVEAGRRRNCGLVRFAEADGHVEGPVLHTAGAWWAYPHLQAPLPRGQPCSRAALDTRLSAGRRSDLVSRLVPERVGAEGPPDVELDV